MGIISLYEKSAFQALYGDNIANANAALSSPSYSISNSNKKKSSGEEDYELKKSLSLRNRKFSFSGYSIKSGGSVETIQMQNNAQIFTKTAFYRVNLQKMGFFN